MLPHCLFLSIMRKLFILLAFFPAFIFAQENFGYFSRSKAVESLPQFKKATEEYEALKGRCQEEIERNEQELTRMYVAYLEGQRTFPEPILRKRQNELQQMVDNSVLFRDQLKLWLAEARDSLYQPSYKAVDDALRTVCEACSFDYAIDTDIAAYRYINPQKGVDITDAVIKVAMNPDMPVTTLFKSNIPACAEDTEQPVSSTADVATDAIVEQ